MDALTIFVLGALDALYLWPLLFLLSSAKTGEQGLERAAALIDAFSARVGATVAWCTLAMVALQFVVVILRYAFGIAYIFLQEGVLYLNAVLFLLAASYTLLADGHVRVDLFYRTASPKRRALVDFVGTYLFLLPVMNAVWFLSFPYVRLSWSIFEGSRETSGIPAVYLLKTVILIFAVLMLLQGFALAARAALRLTGRDGAAEPSHSTAF